MGKINWGIIGCGDVTEMKSGPAFNKVPDSALLAVMRRDGSLAEDYARRHNVPRWYDDGFKLINDPDINAIYIATPPSSHEQYCLAAIQAGKPVYLEKPMSNNYASACRMAAAASAKSVKLVVAHYRREQERFKTIKQLLSDRIIGEPLLVRLDYATPPLTKAQLTDPRMAWRVDPAIAGGGLFHDLAPHQLDLMYYFFGPAQKAVGISANQGNAYIADDLVAGNIFFASGVAFSGIWCFNAMEAADSCEIRGTAGSISFEVFGKNEIQLEAKGRSTILSFKNLQHVQQPMIEATVQFFLDKGPCPCSGHEGAAVMQLLEAFIG